MEGLWAIGGPPVFKPVPAPENFIAPVCEQLHQHHPLAYLLEHNSGTCFYNTLRNIIFNTPEFTALCCCNHAIIPLNPQHILTQCRVYTRMRHITHA